MTTQLLTIPEAAVLLTVSEKTTWRMFYAGKFKSVRIGRSVRVTKESVQDVIEEGTTPPKSPNNLETSHDPECGDDEE